MRRFLAILTTAAYLACSWTWCIGMFLPVLLIRDYGYTSFFIFAVPNVLGAMFMGVALHRPGASHRLVEQHRHACLWFSWVTITFQLFFLFWALPGGSAAIPLVASFGGSALAYWILRGRSRPFVPLILFVLSLGLGLWWANSQRTGFFIVAPAMKPTAMLGLLLVCTFGFALCPYLDLTFHRARQSLPGSGGSTAFVLGFGVLFLCMILLTLLYAGPLLAAGGLGSGSVFPSLLAAPLLAHVSAQLAYTFCVHRGETALYSRPTADRALGLASLVTAAVLAFGVGQQPFTYAGLSAEELIYRLFMSFYGLIFPAYVWLCVIARGPLSRHNLLVFTVATTAAAPMFWMGFIERQTGWLIPGVLLVLAARLLTRRGGGASLVAAPTPGPRLSPLVASATALEA